MIDNLYGRCTKFLEIGKSNRAATDVSKVSLSSFKRLLIERLYPVSKATLELRVVVCPK